MDTASLVWGVVFGAIGGGYLLYAKRQRSPVVFLCGMGLVACTWFVSGTWATLLVGIALMAIPFVVHRFY